MSDMAIRGRFHSKETFGTVDGPGIRYVAFLQGCNLRCLYCHNPDTWNGEGYAFMMSVPDFVRDVLSYRNFIRSGGVTFSGGEPLLQPDFVSVSIAALHDYGIHCAIDTCGHFPFSPAKRALTDADLLLLDIKALDPVLCRTITGQDNSGALQTLEFRQQLKKPVWIRHVLLPGYTLKRELLEEMAAFLSGYSCIEKVELLPFHKMGEFKWKQLRLPYRLKDVRPPEPEEMEMARDIFRRAGLSVHG